MVEIITSKRRYDILRLLHININYIVSALHQTMIEHLNKLNIDNQVFVPTYDKNRSILDVKDYVTISECFNKRDRILFFYKQKKIISTVLEHYDVSKFDCIHAYTLFTDGNVAMHIAKKYNKPYVVAIRNTDVNDFFKKMVYLRPLGVKILKSAKGIFFLSTSYKRMVLDNYIPSKYKDEIASKSYVIPNGIDDFWFENCIKKDTDKFFYRFHKNMKLRCIYVGGIDENKNVQLTLKALTKMNEYGWDCSLIVVGKIVDKKVFKKLRRYNCFRYVGTKSMEQLIAFYRKSDIFIMPSHKETFGLVYAEAMSQGLPVIYTRGQGFDGQFEDGVVGYSVDDKNENSIIEAINKICGRYQKISNDCYKLVDKFDWERICNRYLKIYKAII